MHSEISLLENINDLAFGFNPISLNQMDVVKLMDRVDTKFIFHLSHLSSVIKALEDQYYILEISDTERSTEYETLYFDTNNFSFYLNHHNGKLNRYKIRYRRYINLNKRAHFFEIKFKNNKSRTIKTRIKQSDIKNVIEGKAKKLLETTTNIVSESLLPTVLVKYSRITFVNKNFDERLTIDMNLSFKNHLNEKSFDNLIIAELKRERSCSKSPFVKLMNHEHIHPCSISKYCLGITQLVSSVRTNNFKPSLLNLNKILYATI